MTANEASAELMRLINGYQISQALHVAAALGVADRLKDGPLSADALARACGAHPASLYRLLRALAAAGVFHEGDEREFSLTRLGLCLAGDAQGSTGNYAQWIGTHGMWTSWGNLLHSVRTGECALQFTHGMDAWTYRNKHPEERAVFDRAMTGNSRFEAEAVLEAYDFSQFRHVVDIGGGQGQLLNTILLACPATRGTLFDQPQVIASARNVPLSANLARRRELVTGDFFAAVPGDGEAYLMKAILHDWDDDKAAGILRTLHRSMPPAATLLVIERVIGAANEGPEGKFSDLNMMVQYAALERTRQEFLDLLRQGGFEMTDVIATHCPLSIIAARPVPPA